MFCFCFLLRVVLFYCVCAKETNLQKRHLLASFILFRYRFLNDSYFIVCVLFQLLLFTFNVNSTRCFDNIYFSGKIVCLFEKVWTMICSGLFIQNAMTMCRMCRDGSVLNKQQTAGPIIYSSASCREDDSHMSLAAARAPEHKSRARICHRHLYTPPSPTENKRKTVWIYQDGCAYIWNMPSQAWTISVTALKTTLSNNSTMKIQNLLLFRLISGRS